MQWRVGEDSFHMYSFDVGNSMTSTASSASSHAGYAPAVPYATDYNLGCSSRGPSPPPPPRRRSHRPRGCRGGRKNRKNKQLQQQTGAMGNFPSNGIQDPSTSMTSESSNIGILPGAPFAQRQNQDFPQLSKGNLSAYQHIRTEPSVLNWSSTKQSSSLTGNFESVRCSNNHISPHKIANHNSHYKSVESPSPKKPTMQVLPPALPPFVAGKDPFLQGEESVDTGLKMLPSFGDSVPSERFSRSPVSKISSSQIKQQSESTSSHFAYSNGTNNTATHSHSSIFSGPTATAFGSDSSYSTSIAQLPTLWLDNLLGLSSDHTSGSSSSCSSNNNRNFSDFEDFHMAGGGPRMDSSVISLSSTNSSSYGEEDDRDIHEILFGTEALSGVSLFDTSPRSFLTGGESKAPVW